MHLQCLALASADLFYHQIIWSTPGLHRQSIWYRAVGVGFKKPLFYVFTKKETSKIQILGFLAFLE